MKVREYAEAAIVAAGVLFVYWGYRRSPKISFDLKTFLATLTTFLGNQEQTRDRVWNRLTGSYKKCWIFCVWNRSFPREPLQLYILAWKGRTPNPPEIPAGYYELDQVHRGSNGSAFWVISQGEKGEDLSRNYSAENFRVILNELVMAAEEA